MCSLSGSGFQVAVDLPGRHAEYSGYPARFMAVSGEGLGPAPTIRLRRAASIAAGRERAGVTISVMITPVFGAGPDPGFSHPARLHQSTSGAVKGRETDCKTGLNQYIYERCRHQKASRPPALLCRKE